MDRIAPPALCNESDPTLKVRYLERLSQTYDRLRESPKGTKGALKPLIWTRELLTVSSWAEGHDEPLQVLNLP